MKKKIKNILILLYIVIVLILPYFVFAQSPLNTLQKIQPNSGFTEVNNDADGNNLAVNAGRIVKVFFSLLGIIFIVLMLYAGYHWMTAAGDQGKIEKAQNTIRRAIIGLVITVGSYAISNFVIYKLLNPNG